MSLSARGTRTKRVVVIITTGLAVLGALAPAAAVDRSRRASGDRTWAVVLCSFRDTSAGHDPSWYADLYDQVYPGVGHYWSTVSYDSLRIDTEVFGWYELPRRHAYYAETPEYDEPGAPNLTELERDCTAAAANAGVTLADYDGIALWFDGPFEKHEGYGGLVSVRAEGRWHHRPGTFITDPTTWVSQHLATHPEAVVAHEMGHGFGFGHSSASPEEEYGSDWDVMSNIAPECDMEQGECEPIHPIAYWKAMAGWIPVDRILTAPAGTTTTLRLFPLSGALPSDGHLMAKIPYRGRPETYFTVEARTRQNYDRLLEGDAVIIHFLPGIAAQRPHLITAPGTVAHGEGVMWQPGETFTDPDSNITVSVEGVSEDGSYAVTITSPEESLAYYSRTVGLKLWGHLRAEIMLRVEDGPEDCASGWLRLQRRSGGGWRTIKSAYQVPDHAGQPRTITLNYWYKRGFYRVVADEHAVGWDVCRGAVSRRVWYGG